MLARLEQLVALGLVLIAMVWLVLVGPWAPLLALLGLWALACFHTVFLALEFMLLCGVRRGDPTPPASSLALFKAWLIESLVAPRIFLWQQPFRWRRWPDRLEAPPRDKARRGIVFIHGLVCNRGFWNRWLARLHRAKHPFVAVNLEPVFGDIDAYVGQIEAAVRRITAATGVAPLLVCHSMGGLAARAWLREQGGAGRARVHRVVTIGTPHQGTWLARFSATPNSRQMRQGSIWLHQLARDEAAFGYELFTCYYSDCDNVVMPPAAATLPGADNKLVRGAPHMALAFDGQVMDAVLALTGPSDAEEGCRGVARIESG